MQSADASWFYSSLAQCAAALIGLLAAVLILRLQTQSAAIAEAARAFALAMGEARAEFQRIRSLVAIYRAYASRHIAIVRENLAQNNRSIAVEVERTLSGQRAADGLIDVPISPTYLSDVLDRTNLAFQIEYALEKVSAARSPTDLYVANIYLKQANAQLAANAADREFLRQLIQAVATTVEFAIRVRAFASIRVASVMTGLIVWLSGAGLIAPLYLLPSRLDATMLTLLVAVSTGLLAVPLFVAYELREIRRLGHFSIEFTTPS